LCVGPIIGSAHTVPRSAARCVPQVLERGAQTVARGADVRRRYLMVMPRPMPAAPRKYLIVVLRPFPAAPLVVRRRHLIVVCPRRCSLCVVGTWSWCPVRSPRRRLLCAGGT
jgi:hypothetical protein